MKQTEIILASTSPRRIEYLHQLGIRPIIIPPNVEETIPAGLTTEQTVMFLSLKKALAVESQIPEKSLKVDSVILAADTVVYTNRILGKPQNSGEVLSMLKEMRGKRHHVLTGVTLLRPGHPERRVFYEITEVWFKEYPDKAILAYAMTEEPYDKAGAYAIQGTWGIHVDHINGDRDNVIGFPWARIRSCLQKDFGIIPGPLSVD